MSVKSAERVLKIFDLLSHHLNGLTIKEISESLSFPQSSTSVLINTLYKNNYLSVDFFRKYKLGPKLIQLGGTARDSLDITAQGMPLLKKLMEDVQETVFMAVLDNSELIYVAKINSNRSIRTTAELGKSKPLYCTGLGKAFLTFLPEDRKQEILRTIELHPITPKTITKKENLLKQFEEFFKQGYSIDDEENEEGLYCLAAPIFNVDHMMEAAISVAGPKDRMLRQKENIIEKLLEAASKISKHIGFK